MGGDGNVIQYIEAGIRATGMRGKVLADNIANMNTPDFRRRAVEFEKILAQAVEDGDLDTLRNFEIDVTRPMDTPVGPNGNDVDLDREVGEMIKNSAIRKTYMRLLGKVYDQMEIAIQTSR